MGHGSPAADAAAPTSTAVWEQLRQHAVTHPYREALVLPGSGRRLDFATLAAAAATLQAALRAGPNQRVGLWLRNCEAWVVCMLTCARAGAVLVALPISAHSFTFTAAALRDALRECAVNTLVAPLFSSRPSGTPVPSHAPLLCLHTRLCRRREAEPQAPKLGFAASALIILPMASHRGDAGDAQARASLGLRDTVGRGGARAAACRRLRRAAASHARRRAALRLRLAARRAAAAAGVPRCDSTHTPPAQTHPSSTPLGSSSSASSAARIPRGVAVLGADAAMFVCPMRLSITAQGGSSRRRVTKGSSTCGSAAARLPLRRVRCRVPRRFAVTSSEIHQCRESHGALPPNASRVRRTLG